MSLVFPLWLKNLKVDQRIPRISKVHISYLYWHRTVCSYSQAEFVSRRSHPSCSHTRAAPQVHFIYHSKRFLGAKLSHSSLTPGPVWHGKQNYPNRGVTCTWRPSQRKPNTKLLWIWLCVSFAFMSSIISLFLSYTVFKFSCVYILLTFHFRIELRF